MIIYFGAKIIILLLKGKYWDIRKKFHVFAMEKIYFFVSISFFCYIFAAKFKIYIMVSTLFIRYSVVSRASYETRLLYVLMLIAGSKIYFCGKIISENLRQLVISIIMLHYCKLSIENH